MPLQKASTQLLHAELQEILKVRSETAAGLLLEECPEIGHLQPSVNSSRVHNRKV